MKLTPNQDSIVASTYYELANVGPRRILVDGIGKAVHQVNPIDLGVFHHTGVIFIRNDGWTLGTHMSEAQDAYEMWKSEWLAFCIVKENEIKMPQEMSEWVQP